MSEDEIKNLIDNAIRQERKRIASYMREIGNSQSKGSPRSFSRDDLLILANKIDPQ